MLIIREQQMNLFREAALDSFRQRLHQHLAALLSGDAWSPDRIWREVDSAITEAPSFHLSREVDIARLAELACTRLGGVSILTETLPKEALNILLAYGTDPEEKLRNLSNWFQSTAGKPAPIPEPVVDPSIPEP